MTDISESGAGAGRAAALAGTTREQAGQSATAVKEQASEVGAHAKEQAGVVLGSTKEQVGNVVGDARDQAVDLLSDLRHQLDAQGERGREKIGTLLRESGDELSAMAESRENSSPARSLVQQAARASSSWASTLESGSGSDLLGQVQSLAQRRPGAFLLGALALGALSARATQGAKALKERDSSAGEASSSQLLADRSSAGGQSLGFDPELPAEERALTYGTRPAPGARAAGEAYTTQGGVSDARAGFSDAPRPVTGEHA